MNDLKQFCNDTGISSERLIFAKKDGSLVYQDTGVLVEDWVTYLAISEPLSHEFTFLKYDSHLYSNTISKDPQNLIHKDFVQSHASESTIFKKNEHTNKHEIIINSQTYSTDIFNGITQPMLTSYSSIFIEKVGYFNFEALLGSNVIAVKRSRSHITRNANLDVLDEDNCIYMANLKLYFSDLGFRLVPKYSKFLNATIMKKLDILNLALKDIWYDLNTIPSLYKPHMNFNPKYYDEQRGHHLKLSVIPTGIDVCLETFFKFNISNEDSEKIAKNFIERYHKYNDPIALQAMKFFNILDSTVDSFILQAGLQHEFYTNINVFEDYITVSQMNSI